MGQNDIKPFAVGPMVAVHATAWCLPCFMEASCRSIEKPQSSTRPARSQNAWHQDRLTTSATSAIAIQRAALIPFLEAAEFLNGCIISIAFDKTWMLCSQRLRYWYLIYSVANGKLHPLKT